jgi:hypothetical protein
MNPASNLKNCPACSHQISLYARQCPSCGHPLLSNAGPARWGAEKTAALKRVRNAVALTFLFFWVLYFVGHWLTTAAPKD